MDLNNKKPNFYKRIMSSDFKIVEHGRWYWIAPACIIFLGLIVVLMSNFNLGLDFTGGTILKVKHTDIKENYDAYVRDIEHILSDNGISTSKTLFQKEEADGTGEISMTVKYQDKKGSDETEMEKINLAIKTAIESKIAGATIEDADRISASSGSEKLINSFIAVMFALFGILVYMAFRFKLSSGIAAVIGLAHDVLVMMSLVAIFRIQINANFIAALITIVGYSLNNTLILFDRVREHERNIDVKRTSAQMVNQSVKDTFNRMMNTTITTLVPIFVLSIIGVSLIRQFAIPILFGLVAGMYSTIFITTVLYVRFENAKKISKKLKTKHSLNTKTASN